MLVSSESLTSVMDVLEMCLEIGTKLLERLHLAHPDVLTCLNIDINESVFGAILDFQHLLLSMLLSHLLLLPL